MSFAALEVFRQQDGNVTRSYYEHLERLGPQGHIACCLFRAQKRSSRAKEYSRGKYRRSSYDVKQWSIGELCKALEKSGDELGIRWGWKADDGVVLNGGSSWVLYIELPQGQVSFHSPVRETGPDYSGSWDGVRNASAGRIIQFCDSIAGAPDQPKRAICGCGLYQGCSVCGKFQYPAEGEIR
jgi:hypothetical protein